jgi:hypothetical protein
MITRVLAAITLLCAISAVTVQSASAFPPNPCSEIEFDGF